ncbi:MAG: DUF481 domain-containing protein [Burkholderiales bacterium]|nr:DUF481 domain-containing protein [Burkholderiales bacterium]
MTLKRWTWALGGLLSGVITPVGAATAEAPQTWSGEVDGHYSLAKSAYTTRNISLSADFTRPMPGSELDGEFRFDREFIKLEGTPVEVDSDKYDASLKYKRFIEESPYYAFVSPRTRYDRFGFYRRAQSIRAGGGRKFGGSETWEVDAELGSGYREATVDQGFTVSELLYAMSLKARWAVTDSLAVKFNWGNEWSSRESYTTVTLGIRNKLTDKLGLKYEVVYRRAFPVESQDKGGEVLTDIGLSFRF